MLLRLCVCVVCVVLLHLFDFVSVLFAFVLLRVCWVLFYVSSCVLFCRVLFALCAFPVPDSVSGLLFVCLSLFVFCVWFCVFVLFVCVAFVCLCGVLVGLFIVLFVCDVVVRDVVMCVC